jgi:peptidoglycan/LPS O-acetylase OafA/YrhL
MAKINQYHLQPKYRPDIDGLRAVAVLSVVGYHAFPDWLKGGFIGVDVFFVISGFLISTVIYDSMEKGAFSIRDFYIRRIRRLFPALIVVLASCFFFGWFVLLNDEFKQLSKHIIGGALYISNIVLWRESSYFDNISETKPLLHLWSLGIEEQFYIVFPLLLWVVYKLKLNLLAVTLMVIVGSFYLNITGVAKDSTATFYSPITRFWELMCGAALAWVKIYKKHCYEAIKSNVDAVLASVLNKNRGDVTVRLLSNLSACAGLAIYIYGLVAITKESSFPGVNALVPVSAAILIITANSTAIINRVLSTRSLVWIGLISYPLYLWHWPLLSYARIIDGKLPNLEVRVTIVVISMLLAWVTYKWVEMPFRHGNQKVGLKVAVLCGMMFLIGSLALIAKIAELPHDRSLFRRDPHLIGSSLGWFKGKGDWLFLGNAHNSTVAKMMLDVVPAQDDIDNTKMLFSAIAKAGITSNTKVVLMIAPNKSSIYPEYLPDKFKSASQKYLDFFLNSLKDIDNFTIYNPTESLVSLKKTEGLLYWMTDTHWNHKGAFLAYSGLQVMLGLPVPQIDFRNGSVYKGDLLEMAQVKELPLHAEDNWEVIWTNKPRWKETVIPEGQVTYFGVPSVVTNDDPLSDKYIWVVGDSFSVFLRQYFNSTFKKVRYLGHWSDKLKELPEDLIKADKSPDLLIIIKAERLF